MLLAGEGQSGDKDVAFLQQLQVNLIHPNLVRRFAWDIQLKYIQRGRLALDYGEHARSVLSGTVPRGWGNESFAGHLHRGCHNIHGNDPPGWRADASRDRSGRNAGSGCERYRNKIGGRGPP